MDDIDARVKAAREELDAATKAFFDPLAQKDHVPLDPRLVTWETEHGFMFVSGPPFIHGMYMGTMENRRLNAMLNFKQALYDAHVRDEKWGPILFILCERPYRVNVLDTLKDQMPDQEFWDLLAHAWTDSENCYQNLDLWRKLFNSDRPHRECLMNESEREILADMPEPIEIWHGVDGSEFAWTVNKQVALWFANRFPEKGEPARLRHGFVRHKHVIAYFAGRGEDEILVMPENVKRVTERRVKEHEIPTRAEAFKGVVEYTGEVNRDVDIPT